MSEESQDKVASMIEIFSRFARLSFRNRYMCGVKTSEVRLLLTIRDANRGGCLGTTVSEISKTLHVTSPTVTQMINGLIKQELVVRTTHATDRRVTHIYLTDKGEELCLEALRRFNDYYSGLIAHLGEEESEQLIGLLRQVFGYAESVSPSHTDD